MNMIPSTVSCKSTKILVVFQKNYFRNLFQESKVFRQNKLMQGNSFIVFENSVFISKVIKFSIL